MLQGGAATTLIWIPGCISDRNEYRALWAYCRTGCNSVENCNTEGDPIPSDEEPVASSKTLQHLLDSALDEFSYPDCKGNSAIEGGPTKNETWDDVEETFEDLPHGDILHEDHVIRVSLETEPPEGQLTLYALVKHVVSELECFLDCMFVSLCSWLSEDFSTELKRSYVLRQVVF